MSSRPFRSIVDIVDTEEQECLGDFMTSFPLLLKEESSFEDSPNSVILSSFKQNLDLSNDILICPQVYWVILDIQGV